MSIRPGVRLGDRYQLLTLIATGGMGQVWRAEDTTLHRVVAAKVLRSEFTGDATFLARFRAEAQNTAALSHPNIASVYDYGETVQDSERLAYLVMELVEGEPLVEILHRERRLSPARTLDYLQQAATGLDAAHRAGMVHRDIKPGNLIIRPDGVLKITDFGIARAANNVPLTDNGTVVGTAQYLAPEQAEGRPAIPASDVYALGVVGYECLAGVRPFDGDNSVAIALSQIRDTPRPLPLDISPQIRDLVGRAMAKNPRVRFANGGAFAAAIGVVRSGGTLPGLGGGPGLAPSSATIAAQPGLNPPSQSIAGGQMPPNRPPYAAPPRPGVPPQQPGQPQPSHQQPGQQPIGTGQVPPQGAMGGPPATGMSQLGVVMAGQPATGTSQPGTGQQPSPSAGRTRTWLIIGAAVVVVALIAVIITLIVNSGDDGNSLGGAPQGTPAPQQTSQSAASQTGTQSSQPSSQSQENGDPSQYEPGPSQPNKPKPGQVFSIDMEPIIGAPAEAVVKGLQDLGLVVADIKQDGTGAAPGTVSDVQPNMGLQLGDEVVVHVVPDTDGTPFNRSGRAFVAQPGELIAHPQGLRNIA